MQMTMDSTVKKQRRNLLGEYEKEIQIAMKKFQMFGQNSHCGMLFHPFLFRDLLAS